MVGTLAGAVRMVLLAAVLLAGTAAPGRAINILRDPDIEHALRQLALPLINAAGLNPGQIRILVVKDSKLNAFVIDTQHILIHSGLILKMESAAELQAVLAHELAHIANGHIARRLSNQRLAKGAARFGMLLALAVGAGTGSGEAAAGIAVGASSSAQRRFFSHTRAEEAAADQAALRYMALKGIDTAAMTRVLGYFRGQEVLSAASQDPYVRTHPLTRDRIRAVEGFAAAYGRNPAPPDASAEYWFQRAKGKLGAFLQNPGFTLRKIKKSDTSEIATLRRAIAYHRATRRDKALAEIAKLLTMRPNDAFYRELHGQILLESRNFNAAVNAYGRAVEMAPRNSLILAGYGRSLLTLDTRDANARALRALEQARLRDGRNIRLLQDLALAYARAGQPGMAALASAERYALRGDLKSALVHAKRAADLLPRGSPGWNRAQDVLSAAPATR